MPYKPNPSPYGNGNYSQGYVPPGSKPVSGGVAEMIAMLRDIIESNGGTAQGPIPTGSGGIQGIPTLPGIAPPPDFNKYGGVGNQPYGPPIPNLTPEASDPFNDAIAELDALINQMTGGTAASSHGVMNGIKKAYGAQIGTIKDLNQDAREDTKLGSKEVRKMYRALQKSYNNAAKRESKAGASTAAQLQALGAGSADKATEAAAAINAQNVAAAQALGAPDIAAQLNAEVNAQQQGTANQAIAQAGRSARTALGTSDNERKYYNTQGTTSRLEGTNRAASMYDQLQDYLEGNQNKIAEIAGQRSAALSSAASQMQGAQSDALADIIAKKMQLLGMAEAHAAQQAETAAANQPENPFDAYQKMFPGQVLGDQISSVAPPEVQVALQQLMNDPAMRTGQWQDGDETLNLANNPAAIQQWLLANRETDSFENDADLMRMLQMIINAQLQGVPTPVTKQNEISYGAGGR